MLKQQMEDVEVSSAQDYDGNLASSWDTMVGQADDG